MSKFFTYDERLELQKYLKAGLSFKEISRRLSKNPTTISREVPKNSNEVATGYPGFPFNPCKNRYTCKKKDLCGRQKCIKAYPIYCKLCAYCNKICSDFIEEICTAKSRIPYVCNACNQLSKCTLLKTIYDAERAHRQSANLISESRSGVCSNEDELKRLNTIIAPLILKGQSIHQVYLTHADELMCSEKTLYNYIDACLFDVRNIDLPRKVRFRERYRKPEFKVDKGCRVGRTYEDFQKFLEKNPEASVVQMDSVMGTKGGKCLLTIHFVNTSFMLAFIRDANTSKSVTDIFNQLDNTLGCEVFTKIFPVILTDNGSEFSNPKSIEREEKGIYKTWIFYCDAGCPYQKGAIEVNHELLRRVLPKGSSFNHLEQEDIVKMMNHINSYKRKKLNNRTPYEAFSFYYGEDILKQLGCEPVAPGNIILKPNLLNK